MMKRIGKNYHQIIGINAGLIVSGIAGVLQPTTSALLHNTSTLLISLRSMKNLLPAMLKKLTESRNKKHRVIEI